MVITDGFLDISFPIPRAPKQRDGVVRYVLHARFEHIYARTNAGVLLERKGCDLGYCSEAAQALGCIKCDYPHNKSKRYGRETRHYNRTEVQEKVVGKSD